MEKKYTEIEKQMILAMIVRGFFHGYAGGILDSHELTIDERNQPKTVRNIMLKHYEDIFSAFEDENFMLIARINYSSNEFLKLLFGRKKVKIVTGTQLLALACGSDEFTNMMVEEYKFQFNYLLQGKLPTVSEQMEHFMDTTPTHEYIPAQTAAWLAINSVMRSYARGVKDEGSRRQTIHHATIYRLIAGIMGMMFHRMPVDPEGMDELPLQERLMRKACRNNENYQYVTTTIENVYNEVKAHTGYTKE